MSVLIEKDSAFGNSVVRKILMIGGPKRLIVLDRKYFLKRDQ